MSEYKEQQDREIEHYKKSGERLCKTNSGTDWQIEGLADKMLADDRRGITKHSELRYVLSPSQLDFRRKKEVYPAQGFPEANIISGLYRREYNPLSRGTRTSKATPNLEEVIEYE